MNNNIGLRLTKANTALALKLSGLAQHSGQSAMENAQKLISASNEMLGENTKHLMNGTDWTSMAVAMSNITLGILKLHNSHVQQLTDLGIKLNQRNGTSAHEAVMDWQKEVQSAMRETGLALPMTFPIALWAMSSPEETTPKRRQAHQVVESTNKSE